MVLGATRRNVRFLLAKELVASLGGRVLMIGVDRLDYSKGLAQRLDAFDTGDLSADHAEKPLRNSRICRVGRGPGLGRRRINGKYGEVSWTPIRNVNRVYSRSVLAGLYRTARLGLMTPLRDGMKLVAKEYVAAQDPDDPGVLACPASPAPRLNSGAPAWSIPMMRKRSPARSHEEHGLVEALGENPSPAMGRVATKSASRDTKTYAPA